MGTIWEPPHILGKFPSVWPLNWHHCMYAPKRTAMQN